MFLRLRLMLGSNLRFSVRANIFIHRGLHLREVKAYIFCDNNFLILFSYFIAKATVALASRSYLIHVYYK